MCGAVHSKYTIPVVNIRTWLPIRGTSDDVGTAHCICAREEQPGCQRTLPWTTFCSMVLPERRWVRMATCGQMGGLPQLVRMQVLTSPFTMQDAG